MKKATDDYCELVSEPLTLKEILLEWMWHKSRQMDAAWEKWFDENTDENGFIKPPV